MQQSSGAPLNQSSGSGTQTNYNLTGGTGTAQYNAQNQTIYQTTTSLSSAEAIAQCQNALLTNRPEVDRAALISAKEKRVDGTCEWIWSHPEFQALLRGDQKLLWICGGPGKGKTMISIYLTEKLEEDQGVVYYFCRADDEQHRSAAYVLRSLLWQLTTQQPDVAENLLKHLHNPQQNKNQERQKLRSTLDNREALWALLMNITQDDRFRSAFCVVDGLDECDKDSQQWLAEKLLDSGAESTKSNQLRVVLVSRPTVTTLKKCSQIKLDPDNDGNVNTDLRKFVSEKVKALSDVRDFDDDFRAEVESTLLDRADGTFLWVGFVMIELRRMSSQTEVKEALKTLPKDLSALYDRMLLQIRDAHRKTSALILRWLVLAARPLSLAELGAVIHRSESRSISSDQSTQDRLAACGSLVRVDNGTAGLVHESARDHLLRDEPSSDRILESFRIIPLEAHLEIARTCLAAIERNHQYLRDSARILPWEPLPKPQDPILEYAIMQWPDHARQARQNQDELIGSSPTCFAKRSQLQLDWRNAVVLRDLRCRWWPCMDGLSDSLSIACFLGIEAWCRQLLTSNWLSGIRRVSNRKNKRGLRPLYYASRGSRINVMRLLLGKGAKVNNPGEREKAALYGAVESNSDAAVLWLLEHGADANAREPYGRSQLHISVHNTNHAMLRLLLDYGADPNALLFGTPLHWAVEREDMGAIRLLLDRGADIDIDAKDHFSMTPLHTAVSKGQVEALQLLLNRGANFELRDPFSRKPLFMAVCMPARSVAEEMSLLLLERGANVNAAGNYWSTALHWLVAVRPLEREGTESRIRLLLEHGADAMIQNDLGETPLHGLAGIDPDRHNEYDSPSGVETMKRIARLLLEHGADPMIKDEDGLTPLDIAIKRKHHGLVEVLTEASTRQTTQRSEQT